MTATTIQIAEDALEKMNPSEIEEYLQGAGKPAGLSFKVDGGQVTWDESIVVAEIPVIEAEIKITEDLTPNFNKMTKEQIESYVRDTFDIELDRRLTKAKLIEQAEAAANG